MFPGYAQTYHEQQYTPQVNYLNQQAHQSLAAVQRPISFVKDTHSEYNPTDEETINLSIRSSEKVNIFEVEMTDVPDISEPFQTEVSVIIFDSLQYKPNKTDQLIENSCIITHNESNPSGVQISINVDIPIESDHKFPSVITQEK